MGHRILIHCDLDAFFAAVETIHQNLSPDIPLIIGSDPKFGSGRGIVSTCNYAAREFGIRSAMPISEAWRRCPGPPIGNGLYMRTNFRLYRRASKRVMRILSSHADQFEQASVDEAYLDVTESSDGDWNTAERIARDIQKEIFDEIRLTASFGIGQNRVIAKMASEVRKPNGIFMVPFGGHQEFFETKSCVAVPGIGPKAGQLLREVGIVNLKDAYREGPDTLEQYLGKRRASSLWNILEGKSSAEVSPLRSRKSISKEVTFSTDQNNPAAVMNALPKLVENVATKLRAIEITARSIEVKIRYKGFETYSHGQSLPVSMDEFEVFKRIAMKLLSDIYDTSRSVRLIGVKLSELEAPPNRQSTLQFLDEEE